MTGHEKVGISAAGVRAYGRKVLLRQSEVTELRPRLSSREQSLVTLPSFVPVTLALRLGTAMDSMEVWPPWS